MSAEIKKALALAKEVEMVDLRFTDLGHVAPLYHISIRVHGGALRKGNRVRWVIDPWLSGDPRIRRSVFAHPSPRIHTILWHLRDRWNRADLSSVPPIQSEKAPFNRPTINLYSLSPARRISDELSMGTPIGKASPE